MFQLEYCKSINGIKNGFANETIPKLHFARYKQDMKAQKCAKRLNVWAKWAKTKNRKF